jgi:hypothetical protein
MAGTINLQHDTRNSGANGYLTDGNIVTIGANPNGLGIFNYIGTNRGTTARSNPCSQPSNGNYIPTAVNFSHIGTVGVWGDPNIITSCLSWTDGSLANGGFGGATLVAGNGIVYDFCKSFNAFSIVAGQIVSNQALVKPDTIMMYWSGSIGGASQGFTVFGSRDGGNWDTLATISDGPRSWVTGWVAYQLSPKRYYRYVKIVGGSAGVQFYTGSWGFMELDIFGKIKFLETSII